MLSVTLFKAACTFYLRRAYPKSWTSPLAKINAGIMPKIYSIYFNIEMGYFCWMELPRRLLSPSIRKHDDVFTHSGLSAE